MSSEIAPVIYRSLEQVLHTFKTSQIGKTSEVRQLLKVSAAGVNGILDPNTLLPKVKPLSVIKPKMPFIVIEGLDGSGKTKVSTALTANLDLERYQTPPERIRFLKEFFDELDEPIRRCYYSLGNYLAAKEVSNSKFKKGVIMDRYWHSTAAFAAAHELAAVKERDSSKIPQHKASPGIPIVPADYIWPSDLLQPDLVIFLVVSEDIRKYRHKLRNTTNSKEEQILSADSDFRERLIDCYRRITGPSFQEISADEDIELVKEKVCEYVSRKFPVLVERLKSNSLSNTQRLAAAKDQIA